MDDLEKQFSPVATDGRKTYVLALANGTETIRWLAKYQLCNTGLAIIYPFVTLTAHNINRTETKPKQ